MSLQSLFNRLYLMIILLLIVLCVVAFNPDNVTHVLSGVAATNLQQILVLLGLGGLPGLLIWSSREVKKLKVIPLMENRIARYRVILYVRLAVFAFIGLYIILMQFLTQMVGAFMFMMVVFVLFAFVWPTKARFETELAEEEAKDGEAIDDEEEEIEDQDEDEEEKENV